MTLLKARLRVSEGWRPRMYYDTVGVPTIGYGHSLLNPISPRAGEVILEDDIQTVAIGPLDKHLPWWRALDGVRQVVLAEMAFNLGIVGLLGFTNTLRAVQERRWADAARGMLASKWARQVKGRAVELAAMMETGEMR